MRACINTKGAGGRGREPQPRPAYKQKAGCISATRFCHLKRKLFITRNTIDNIMTTLGHLISLFNLLTINWLATFDKCHCLHQLAHGDCILELDLLVGLYA